MSAGPATDHLAEGRAALERADWPAARRCFEAALAGAESAEAWEGLSRAAWWMHDADATLDARERAYRAFRRAGDVEGSARLASWIASDSLDLRGDHAAASAWLRRAASLLEGREPGVEHALVDLLEADIALLSGQPPARAAEKARAALDLGRRLGSADVEAVARAELGTALVAAGDAEAGLRELAEAGAIATGEDIEDPAAGGWALCHTVTGFAEVGALDSAVEWCRSMGSFCEAWSSRNFFGVCRTAYGDVLAARGEWASAEEELARAIEGDAGPVSSVASALLGRLRARQGRVDEARHLYESALPIPQAVVGLGELDLVGGDPVGAAHAAERVLRRIDEASVLARLPALELLARARAEVGDHEAAATLAAEVAQRAAALGTPYMRARSHLVGARVRLLGGDHDGARTAAEDAVDHFGECGAPYDAARAREVLGDALEALGRRERAAAERAAARDAMARLGAPAAADGELSAREVEVLRLVARGLSDGEVAERLVVSPHTVHRHMANIRTKLRLGSRSAAVAHAVRAGLV